MAGLDAAFSPDGSWCLGVVVLWDACEQKAVDRAMAWRRLRFPYIPGLLSFRESPALLAALRRLGNRPDVLLCDGQGLAHPRRFGLACHLGLWCNLPSVGCAKSRLIGDYEEPAPARGAATLLLDGGETVGIALRTQPKVRPVFVSVGHRTTLEQAKALILTCSTRYRLPEPTRLADRWTKAERDRRPQPRRSSSAD